MRVGVNCFPMQANMGGLKQYFLTLFDGLLSAGSESQYTFFYFRHNEEQLSHLASRRWMRDALLLTDQRQIANHFDRLDLYFCPFGALWPRPAPIPSIVMLPDIQETRYPQFFTPEDLFQRDWHFRGSTRIADMVITISEFSKQTLVEHHRIRPDKIRVIYPAADERYYRASEIESPAQQPLPDSFIFYPANRWRHKNHDGLLRALSILRYQHALPIHAAFTGHDVPNGYSIAARAAELGIADQVHQCGYLAVEQVAYLYRRARLLVFPSLYEGFGIPIVESMAAGCPVVCADHTSLPEIAGRAAVYFDPTSPEAIAASIREAWEHDRLRLELRERGLSRARDFSSERLAREHLSAFQYAVANYQPSRAWRKHVHESFRRRLVHAKRALGIYSRTVRATDPIAGPTSLTKKGAVEEPLN